MLKARVITALILLAGLLLALFLLPPLGWLGFAAVLGGAAAVEWAGMLGFGSGGKWFYGVLVGALAFVVGLVAGLHQSMAPPPFGVIPFYFIAAVFWIACVPLWLRARWQMPGRGTAAAVGLILLLPTSLAVAHLRSLSPWLLLGVMAAVWVADISAYFAGRAFGKHKLAPAISPGKSWEGVAGAAGGVVAYGLACVTYLGLGSHLPGGLICFAFALLAFTGISVIGDLFESLIKRQAGVKDSGTLLPGHGGLLDRIDSLTSTLPLAGLAALWLAR